MKDVLCNSALKRIIAAAVLWTPSIAMAQSNDWWFDIEVLLFDRKVDMQQLAEQFDQRQHNINVDQGIDLITPYLVPNVNNLRDALPLCFPEPETPPPPVYQVNNALLPVEEPEATEITNTYVDLQSMESDTPDEPQDIAIELPEFSPIQWQLPDNSACVFASEQRLLDELLQPNWQPGINIERVPSVINGIENTSLNSSYLLPSSQFELKKLASDLHRQRDISPLLHLAWRQQVLFGRNKAKPYHLYAGNNYQDDYALDGSRLRETTDATVKIADDSGEQTVALDLIGRIEQALAEDHENMPIEVLLEPQQKSEQPLWQLDGLFKVYLQYINRVPYLHIDSEFNYRKEILQRPSVVDGAAEQPPELALKPFYFQQLRRVISTQLHYFDHPLFGMVVQIRRYQKPEPEEETEGENQ